MFNPIALFVGRIPLQSIESNSEGWLLPAKQSFDRQRLTRSGWRRLSVLACLASAGLILRRNYYGILSLPIAYFCWHQGEKGLNDLLSEATKELANSASLMSEGDYQPLRAAINLQRARIYADGGSAQDAREYTGDYSVYVQQLLPLRNADLLTAAWNHWDREIPGNLNDAIRAAKYTPFPAVEGLPGWAEKVNVAMTGQTEESVLGWRITQNTTQNEAVRIIGRIQDQQRQQEILQQWVEDSTLPVLADLLRRMAESEIAHHQLTLEDNIHFQDFIDQYRNWAKQQLEGAVTTTQHTADEEIQGYALRLQSVRVRHEVDLTKLQWAQGVVACGDGGVIAAVRQMLTTTPTNESQQRRRIEMLVDVLKPSDVQGRNEAILAMRNAVSKQQPAGAVVKKFLEARAEAMGWEFQVAVFKKAGEDESYKNNNKYIEIKKKIEKAIAKKQEIPQSLKKQFERVVQAFQRTQKPNQWDEWKKQFQSNSSSSSSSSSTK